MYSVTRRLEFDAGHRVPLHASKCRSPHGHRYVVEVTCAASRLTPEGFVVDFGEIKRLIGGWIDRELDHTMLAQRGDSVMEAFAAVAAAEGLRPFYWMNDPPTAENIAKVIHGEATRLLAGHHLVVCSVVVHETPNCAATWTA